MIGSRPLPFGPGDDTLPFLRAAFPDLTMSVEDNLADGDRVAARVRVQGTHARSVAGLEPTGRRIDVQHIHVFHVRDWRTDSWWAGRDDLGLAIQLGLLSPPGSANEAGWFLAGGRRATRTFARQHGG